MAPNNTLRDKMLAVISDVNSELAEREELVELIAIALLTRKNLFILGRPGQAKSYAINLFRRHISGARQFERLLSKQTDEEQLFGRIDLSSLIPGAVPESVLRGDPIYKELRLGLQEALSALDRSKPETWETLKQAADRLEAYRSSAAALHNSEPAVQTAGKIPEADIVFLDELFKCNDGVLNSLLTALNERKYTNEGNTYTIPAISFFAASNEIPNFSDPQEDIAEREKRLGVLKSKQSGAADQVRTTITLDELLNMQAEVSSIPVPDSVNELADDVLCRLRAEGIAVSDRKYLGYYPLAQAKAWLSGHVEAAPEDLLVLKCYLWQKPGDLAAVESTLNRLCVNPLRNKADSIRAMADEVKSAFDSTAAGAEKPGSVTKGLIKLRGELVRLYTMQQELESAAVTDDEKQITRELLADIEKISRDAHDAAGFTYIPLEQLAALQ